MLYDNFLSLWSVLFFRFDHDCILFWQVLTPSFQVLHLQISQLQGEGMYNLSMSTSEPGLHRWLHLFSAVSPGILVGVSPQWYVFSQCDHHAEHGRGYSVNFFELHVFFCCDVKAGERR